MDDYYQPKILVVDDDKVLCELLCMQLYEEKFRTDFALDGIEAIKKIKKTNYSLVILNQNMRFMNGDKALVEIKKYDSSIPVIMLSAQSDPEIIVRCIKLGADDYFTKPYEYDEILDAVIKYLRIEK